MQYVRRNTPDDFEEMSKSLKFAGKLGIALHISQSYDANSPVPELVLQFIACTHQNNGLETVFRQLRNKSVVVLLSPAKRRPLCDHMKNCFLARHRSHFSLEPPA